MKNLWLDIGNTRLKYWITQEDQILEQGAELHLQSPADFRTKKIMTESVDF